jgi:hypothetical protein
MATILSKNARGLGRVFLLHVDPSQLAMTKESNFVDAFAKNG